MGRYLRLRRAPGRINDVEPRYYADGEDAYDMRKYLKPKQAQITNGGTGKGSSPTAKADDEGQAAGARRGSTAGPETPRRAGKGEEAARSKANGGASAGGSTPRKAKAAAGRDAAAAGKEQDAPASDNIEVG